MSRFVRPDVTVLKITNGDTLTVRRRLNAGEQRAAFARMYLAGVDGTLKVNPLATGMATITAYLLDWSLTDDEGKLVVIRDQPAEVITAALDALSPEDYAEVLAAIDTHEQAMLAEREEKKRIRAGEIVSDPILLSPSAPASPSMKSETLM